MYNRTRLLAVILSISIAIGALPTAAVAAENESPANSSDAATELSVGIDNQILNEEENSNSENAQVAATGDQLLGEDSIEGSSQSADDQSGATGSTEHKEEGEPAPDEENDGNVTEEEQSENEAIDSSTSDVVEPIENNEEKEADSAPKNKSEIDMTGALHFDSQIGRVTMDGKSSDERFEEYVDSLFYGNNKNGKRKAKSHSGYRLTGQDRAIYDCGAEAAEEIVTGQTDKSEFYIYLDALGIDASAVYTAADLDVDYLLDTEGEVNPQVFESLNELINFRGDKVIECLFADYPMELYWADYDLRYALYPDFDIKGDYLWFTEDSLWFGIVVENQFRSVRDTENEEDLFTVDVDRITAAAEAAENAVSIIEAAPGDRDVDIITYYKDQIRSLSVYNHEAADTDGYSLIDRGPWALIYVFDGDPNTNVVCEGYTRAFQYLCDRTRFNDSQVCAYSVGGNMSDSDGTFSGAHAWNIVHMDDGRNYIADVTNTEDDDSLFLCGMEPDYEDPYTYFTWGNDHYYIYEYDDITKDVFTLNELTLSLYDYGEEGCMHEFGNWVTVQKKTCEIDGVREKSCIICGDIVSQIIPAGHTWNTTYTVDIKPTLTKSGLKSIHCKYCDASKDSQRVPKLISVVKASVTIISPKTYTGKAIVQAPKVVVNKYRLKAGKDYKITYKNNKSVGTATMTIIGMGRYGGQISKTFVINPKGTSLASLTPASKKITVKWKKQATQTTGYQIQYSTDKSFKKGVKSVNKKGASAVSTVISGLTSNKTYYIRIRTYKTVGGKTYYSTWSGVKSAKAK